MFKGIAKQFNARYGNIENDHLEIPKDAFAITHRPLLVTKRCFCLLDKHIDPFWFPKDACASTHRPLLVTKRCLCFPLISP